MLKKLFLYDFRRLRRLSLPALLGMACATLFCIASIVVCFFANNLHPIFLTFGALFTGLGFLLLILFSAAPVFINYFYFAQNMFFDEGYLTLTLPATEHQTLLSKFFAGFLWLLIDAICAITAICLLIGSYVLLLYLSIPELFVFDYGTGPSTEGGMPFVLIAIALVGYLLYLLVYLAFEVILGMTVITLGCLVMPKHKIIGIILSYLVSNWAISFITEIISFFIMLQSAAMPWVIVTLPFTFALVIAGIGIGLYFLTHYMLKHRINLE